MIIVCRSAVRPLHYSPRRGPVALPLTSACRPVILRGHGNEPFLRLTLEAEIHRGVMACVVSMSKPLKRLNCDECGMYTGLKVGVNEKKANARGAKVFG